MIFIVVLALVLYIYRFFRKTGINIPSNKIAPSEARTISLPLVKQTLYETIESRSDEETVLFWEGNARITNKKYFMCLRRVANGLTKLNLTSGEELLISSKDDCFMLTSCLELASQHLGFVVCFGKLEEKDVMLKSRGGVVIREKDVKKWMEDSSLDSKVDSQSDNESVALIVSERDSVLSFDTTLGDERYTQDEIRKV